MLRRIKPNFFYPYEVNFNSFYNTYFCQSISSDFSYRSFQPKFYEFIKYRIISFSALFNTFKYKIFQKFQGPGNLFKPSLFSSTLLRQQFFKNEYFLFFDVKIFFYKQTFIRVLRLENFSLNYSGTKNAYHFDKQLGKKGVFPKSLPFFSSDFSNPKIAVTTPDRQITHSFRFFHVFPYTRFRKTKKFIPPFFIFGDFGKTFDFLLNTYIKNFEFFNYIITNKFTQFYPFKTIYKFFQKSFKFTSVNPLFNINDFYNIKPDFTDLLISPSYTFGSRRFLLKKQDGKIFYDYALLNTCFKTFSYKLLLLKRFIFLNKFYLT